MDNERSKQGCPAARFFRKAYFLMLLAFAAIPQLAGATSYVMLNDGRMHVFPDTCVSSIVEDEEKIVFTSLDGKQFSYMLTDVQSIENSLPKELPVIISFNINNDYNYQVMGDAIGTISGDKIDVTVRGIGKRLTPKFMLSDAAAMAWVDGKEQQSKVSRLRFDPSRTYIVGYPGDMILSQQSADMYDLTPFGREYTVTIDYLTDHSTTVPRVDINTEGGVSIISKVNYYKAEIIIDGAGVFRSMTDSLKIRGRGNTSWTPNATAKNPYRLKFYKQVKPFGLASGKNWVLLANKMYGSMLTNAFGMKAASLLGVMFTNHIIPVDLYINGTYRGHYNFTEKIGIADNSIDLDDEGAATLLELDTYYDEPAGQKFRSDPRNMPVNVKFPEFGDDFTVLTLGDIESRFNGFVSAVMNGEDLEPHVDIDKLARYLLANELICNKEIFHPKSTFCYHENILDEDSKFIFGPMWDLDWACGYLMDYPNSYFMQLTTYDFFNSNYNGNQYQFFHILIKDKKLSKRMYEIWREFMGDGLDELCEFCQDYYEYAEPSLIKSKTAYADYIDYGQQAAHAPGWFRARANLIYERLKRENRLLGDVNDDGDVTITDVTVLIDYLLGGLGNSFNADNADVDDDGQVNISDVTALIDKLLGL